MFHKNYDSHFLKMEGHAILFKDFAGETDHIGIGKKLMV